jgi:hypothetical protein
MSKSRLVGNPQQGDRALSRVKLCSVNPELVNLHTSGKDTHCHSLSRLDVGFVMSGRVHLFSILR